MSVWAAGERSASHTALNSGYPRAGATGGRHSLGLRATAFAGLAAFASLQYATLLSQPPTLRVVGAVAIATAGGTALELSGYRRAPAPLAWALRGLLVLLVLALALLAVGVPAHLLRPDRWGALVHDVNHGFLRLEGWLWPYLGGDVWARLAVLMVLPVALVVAAGAYFWPSTSTARLRRLGALGVLLAVCLTGIANESAPAWGFQGAALVALIAAWLWLPRVRPGELGRAWWWLLACCAVALVGARAVSGSPPWIDYRSWDPVAVTTSFQWDQLYGPLSWSRSSATMFTVAEEHPQLLRVTSLDRFDGLRFLRSNEPPGSPEYDLPNPPDNRGYYRRATVTIEGLRSNLAASAGGVPVGVMWRTGSGQSLSSQNDGTAVFGSTPTRGARYEVFSYLPTPSPATLRRAPRTFPRAYLPYTEFELPSANASALTAPNLIAEEHARLAAGSVVGAPAPGRTPASDSSVARRIEASPYASMFSLAQALAAGAPTTYDVAERIERFLLTNYTYDENVNQSRYPLETFLFNERRGYCQQFSGAMTLMLRMDGIPARVGVGFKPDAYDAASGTWQIRALDAHAWVEVFFSGVGWVPFDPTPARTAAASGVVPELTAKEALLGGHGPSSAFGESSLATSLTHARVSSRPGRSGVAPIALGGGAALLLTGLAAWWIAGARRLRRLLRSGDADAAVEELRWALARLGYRLSPTITLARLESELRVNGNRPDSSYLSTLRELRYGSARGIRANARERAALRRLLGRRGGSVARVRLLLVLPPGVTRRRFRAGR